MPAATKFLCNTTTATVCLLLKDTEPQMGILTVFLFSWTVKGKNMTSYRILWFFARFSFFLQAVIHSLYSSRCMLFSFIIKNFHPSKHV
ncbi:MAG: hypothetical protein AYK18_08995 [Theionarchaea archaeon DG-70]|nr:MAG: hypothetical protein AYK18_08995 [Theionarchaea archaeon DG-70]